MGALCDNIALVMAGLPSGSTNASVSHSQSTCMTQSSGILILPPVQVGDPYIPQFLIYMYSFHYNGKYYMSGHVHEHHTC